MIENEHPKCKCIEEEYSKNVSHIHLWSEAENQIKIAAAHTPCCKKMLIKLWKSQCFTCLHAILTESSIYQEGWHRWWWVIVGAVWTGWHQQGARGCGVARRRQPCIHAAYVWLVMYMDPHLHLWITNRSRSIRIWSLSRDEFCSSKRKKVQEYCYVSVWVWVFYQTVCQH